MSRLTDLIAQAKAKDAGGGFLQPAGIIGSVIGAIIVLLVYLRAGRRHGARV